jgi:mannose-6-phosphate isomerase-like protein (cupin superfamily)
VEVRSIGSAPVYTTKDGSSVRALFEFGNVARNQSLVEASLPPGGSTERHLHATSEELYVILEGAGDMEIEGDRAPVTVGDVVLIPPGARHRITATGDGPLRFLCCCSPPYRHEDTILDS